MPEICGGCERKAIELGAAIAAAERLAVAISRARMALAGAKGLGQPIGAGGELALRLLIAAEEGEIPSPAEFGGRRTAEAVDRICGHVWAARIGGGGQ